MKYIVRINDKEYEVEVERGKANVLRTTVINTPPAASTPVVPAAPVQATPAAPAAAAVPIADVSVADGEIVKAPMPGIILDIKVSAGSSVKKGDILMILEAMKMENEIAAPVDGVIKQILVSKGATVETNDVMLVIG